MPDQLPVVVGLIAGVSGLALPRMLRSSSDAVLAAAVVLAVLMVGTDLAPLSAGVGVALLVVGLQPGRSFGIRAGGVILGSLALGFAMPSAAPEGLGVVTVVFGILAGAVVAVAVWRLGPRPALWLIAVVPATAYGAVPDTEQVTVVAFTLGVLALGALVWPGLLGSAPGLVVFGPLSVWAIAVGSAGRQAAMASLACFGVLVLAPLWWWGRGRLSWPPWTVAAVALVHVGAGVLAARWAGLGTDVSQGVVRALLVLDAAAVVVLVTMWTALRLAR